MQKLVEINPKVCGGKPVIAGTRIPVSVILDHLGDGIPVEEIEGKYPELSRDQILGAIRFCHDVIERTELEPA